MAQGLARLVLVPTDLEGEGERPVDLDQEPWITQLLGPRRRLREALELLVEGLEVEAAAPLSQRDLDATAGVGRIVREPGGGAVVQLPSLRHR